MGRAFSVGRIMAPYGVLKVVDQSGNYKEFYGVYFGAGGYYWLDVSATDWSR